MAVKAGKLLARRLFNESPNLMNYDIVSRWTTFNSVYYMVLIKEPVTVVLSIMYRQGHLDQG